MTNKPLKINLLPWLAISELKINVKYKLLKNIKIKTIWHINKFFLTMKLTDDEVKQAFL